MGLGNYNCWPQNTLFYHMGDAIYQSLSQSFVFLRESITGVDPLVILSVSPLNNSIAIILSHHAMSWL
jgi:hypothetical protein